MIRSATEFDWRGFIISWLGLLLIFTLGCGRPTGAPISTPPFDEVAAQTGLRFIHNPYPSGQFYMPEIMGSGVALFDYDNDGDLDVYLVQAMPLDRRQAAPSTGNRLFRNELVPSGKLSFTDVTAVSGTGAVMYGMGVATGDYDADGFTDLYVTAFGHNILYRNRGDGTFENVTAIAGVDDERWSTSAAFLDYDRDGDLDLFVLNYVDFTVANHKPCAAPSGEPDFCTPKAYRGVPARLFRNNGNGRFTDVSASSGISSAFGPGLGVTCGDFDGDGWMDIYVANDTSPNLLWRNRRNGTFADQGLMTGVAYSEDGLAKAGMGVSAGDYDNDGDEDIAVVNLAREGATLFQNDSGGFQDVSLRLALRPLTLAGTGFGAGFIDYDNDGWLDLFVANGAVTLVESLRGTVWPYRQKNTLLRNAGGVRFEPVAIGEREEVGRGAAFGDVDNDGDVDVLVSNNNGPVRLFLNRTSTPSLSVSLDRGAGAMVSVLRRGASTLRRRSRTDASYLSASDSRVHFGLGGGGTIEAIEVLWPEGRVDRFPPPPAGTPFVHLRRR